MKISIVVPVYNAEDYLPTCMASLLNNDCTACEIILVDDGSTDGVSPALCDSYARENPKLVRVIHQPNGGPGTARNAGLQEARGEYVFFVDSDDTIAPNSLELLHRAVEQSHADIYLFQMAVHVPGGPVQHVKIAQPSEQPCSLANRPELLLSQPAIWARLWRRELFLSTGIRFPDRSWVGEDLRTVTKLNAAASRIVVLPDTLYFYLIRPGSLMRSENVERNRDMLLAFEDILTWYREQGLLEQYDRELCCLAAEHLLLAASVRVARADPEAILLREFLRFMEEHFPKYRENLYVKDMSRRKRLALWLVEHQHYKTLRLLFTLKDRL